MKKASVRIDFGQFGQLEDRRYEYKIRIRKSRRFFAWCDYSDETDEYDHLTAYFCRRVKVVEALEGYRKMQEAAGLPLAKLEVYVYQA